MNQSKSVSEQLKKFFEARGYTQCRIAEILGVSQQVVQSLLNGRAFGKKTAGAWSKHFGFNPAWLITGEGAMMLADKCNIENTVNTAVFEMSQSVANEILRLITEGQLYTKNAIKLKDEIIRQKDDEIHKLNREIGALQAQLEQYQQPAKIKKDAV